MRFANVIVPKQPLRTPAAELMRRLAGDPLKRNPPPPKTQDLPVELDQRVRLVGEW